jgi:hypothetical protein
MEKIKRDLRSVRLQKLFLELQLLNIKKEEDRLQTLQETYLPLQEKRNLYTILSYIGTQLPGSTATITLLYEINRNIKASYLYKSDIFSVIMNTTRSLANSEVNSTHTITIRTDNKTVESIIQSFFCQKDSKFFNDNRYWFQYPDCGIIQTRSFV